MLLIALLAVPLVGAAILSRGSGRAATVVHGLTALATIALAVAVGVTVARETTLQALGGFLRADALSAWMVALVGLVAGLAAVEAPHYAHGAARRFYPFFHLFVMRTDATGWNVLALALLLASVFFLFYSLNYRSLVIRLTADSLILRFGLLSWAVPLHNVAECRLDDLPALVRYGGAGVHFMFVGRRYRVSFNLLEYPRVVLAHKKPGIVRDISFTTRQPERIIRLLNTAKPQATGA